MEESVIGVGLGVDCIFVGVGRFCGLEGDWDG